MKIPSVSRTSSAFSLVELLTVIGIITVLAGAGTVALRDAGKSVQSATNAASSLFNLARTEAILRRTEVRVVVDTNFQPASPENFLRRLAVVARKADGTWEMVTRWTALPGNSFFHEQLSATHGIEEMPGIPGGRLAYFSFRPNGQAASSRSQFILAAGEQREGRFQEKGENQRAGFFVHRLGRLSFFQSPSEIVPL